MIKLGISDVIAGFIDDMLSREDGTAELKRADLANRFGCVPSQINYVISTRFSPERGYIVESRRGGGGYIRIRKVHVDPQRLIMHTVNAVGNSIEPRSAAALISNIVSVGVLSASDANIILAGISDAALRPVAPEGRDTVRASILKQMLISTL